MVTKRQRVLRDNGTTRITRYSQSDDERTAKRKTNNIGLAGSILADAAEAWTEYKEHTSTEKNFQLHYHKSDQPFRCVVLHDALQNKPEFPSELPLASRASDLYSFRQTRDDIASQYPELLAEIQSIIVKITGFHDLQKPDLFAAIYAEGDYLLCHDDNIPIAESDEFTRKVAFIYYFVDSDWHPDDGGTLDLFKPDQNGQPQDIRVSLTPKQHALAFFEVNDFSFHQVSCVLAKNGRERRSLTGWFYAPTPSERRKPRPVPPLAQIGTAVDTIDSSGGTIPLNPRRINAAYCAPETVKQLHDQFVKESIVVCKDFLANGRGDRLLVSSKENVWSLVGPANRRRYYASSIHSIPTGLPILVGEIAAWVLNVSGLKVNPSCLVEYRKFEPGCYTLLASDSSSDETESKSAAKSKLEIILCIEGCEGQGNVHYATNEEHLAEIEAVSFQLSMVMKDPGTMSFTKLLKAGRREDIVLTFEIEDD